MRKQVLTLALALLAAPPALAASPYSDEITDLSIRQARTWNCPGSAFTVRQTLSAGANYGRYLVSYQSEGLRIDGLLTVPGGSPPRGG